MCRRENSNMEPFIREIQIDWSAVPAGSYLHGIPALASLTRLLLSKPVTFLVGENGTGKSTLIEAIAVACGFAAEGGSLNYNFSTYDSHSPLHAAVRTVRGRRRQKWGYFLRAESFYNVATQAEAYRGGDSPAHYYQRYGGKSLHEQSHGESFLALIQGDFRADGLYILDEPEAALSPQRQLTLLLEIDRLSRQGAQFIVATHSPILLGLPGAQIWSLDGGRVHACDYTETESYRVTEMFINNRDYFLRHLLGEE